MNPLNDYINRARSQGQTDDQIKQALIHAGWPAEKINAGLTVEASQKPITSRQPLASSKPTDNSPQSSLAMGQQVKGKGKNKLPIALACLLVVVVVITGFIVESNKTSYKTVANEFITAVRNQNQTKADSLESTSFMNYAKKITGTASFEGYCVKSGLTCTRYFTKAYLDKAKITETSYLSSKGIKGKTILYTIETSNYSAACKKDIKSVDTLEVDLIPKANSWLIDNVNPASQGSASSDCSVPGA